MGLRMIKDNNIIGPEELIDMDKKDLIRELEARGATADNFHGWQKRKLIDFLIEFIDPRHEKLSHLHSECK